MEEDDWHKGSLLELSGYYWRSCTLHAAVKLDIFTVIGDEEVSAEDVASRLAADAQGVERLLNALVAMGLLAKVDGRWVNTMTGRSLLSKDADGYIGHIIRHHHHLAESWIRLDEAVKGGKPVRDRVSHGEAEWRESFLMGMFNLAMETAPRVADMLALSGYRHLLDVGGGPGTFAIHFCLKNPDLEATVYDLPTTRPFAEKTIARFDLTDRVRFLPGNYVEQDIPGSYDVAWLSHILHGEGPETCRRIVKKVVSTLTPGGRIIVHDFILNDTMDGPVFPALFSLNMLLGTSAGQSYSEAQITDMLSAAGVKRIERAAFRGPTDSGIILGAV